MAYAILVLCNEADKMSPVSISGGYPWWFSASLKRAEVRKYSTNEYFLMLRYNGYIADDN